MLKYIFVFLPCFAFALSASPTPFPVFLKAGFSTVLEFEEAPTKVVLGDAKSFQVEKLDRSIVIKTLAPYANTNMFVYFKTKEPRLFVLTASEEAEPTYYKKFETLAPPKPAVTSSKVTYRRGATIISAKFTPKKDFLTIEAQISSDSRSKISPHWDKIALVVGKAHLKPDKLWSERKEVQKDAKVKARFVFNKPNLPRDLKSARLVIPFVESATPFAVALAGRIQ